MGRIHLLTPISNRQIMKLEKAFKRSSSKHSLWEGTTQVCAPKNHSQFSQFSSVQLLSCVRLFATPWTTVH